MTKQNDPASRREADSEGQIFRADTVPPPAGGDAYSAATVVREAPPEVLEAIRERKKALQAASGEAPKSRPVRVAPRAAPVPDFQFIEEPSVPRLNLDDDDDGPRPEEDGDGEENAGTMVRVSPSSPAAPLDENDGRVHAAILGPTTSVPDTEENPLAWRAALSPAGPRPTMLLLLVGALLFVLVVLAAASWDSLR